ncbi:MAG TPA: hypothetical protein VGO50_21270 [Pyrinomonadaceae bacterium]|jgi:hypothetical protein|nr:hypothetical protein [Pyrinomonadaceae bacterium]
MKNFLLAATTFLLLAAPCLAEDLPFTIESGFIIVSARVKKDISVEVALSTGLPSSVVESAPNEKFKLQTSYTNDGPVMNKNSKVYLFMDVPDIIVGSAKPTALKMALSPQFGVGKKIGREIFGVLGADFFKGKIIQFDFLKKVVRSLDHSPETAAPSAAGNSSMTFKMTGTVDTPVNLAISVPVVQEILYNGKKLRTLFNTGSGLPVAISSGAMKELQLDPLPEKGKTVVGKVKSLKMYDLELNDVPSLFYGKDAGFEQDRIEYDAAIGLGILKNFIATFDFKEKTVTLERPAAPTN